MIAIITIAVIALLGSKRVLDSQPRMRPVRVRVRRHK